METGPWKIKRLSSLCLALSYLLLHTAVGQTISPGRLLGRYQQFVWTDQHGLPQNGISTVAQTPDGYLWLATAEGMVRFDGVRFTAFDTANTPELKSNNISVLQVDRAGALWAGYGGGLTKYKDGRFTYYGAAEGMSDIRVTALFEDRAGNLWIGGGGGVNVYRDGRFTSYTTKDGLPDNRIWAFAEDAEGGLWVGTQVGLARFKDGRFTNHSTRDGLASNAVRSLYYDRAGTLWVGADNGGLSRWQAGRFTTAGVPTGLQRQRVQAIAEDRAGNVWIGSIGGLYRYKDGRFDVCTERDGLVNDEVQALHCAANGSLWLGTSGGGLVLLKEGRFTVYTTEDGLPDEIIGSIRGDGAGNLWVNTRSGLSRFKDGRFTTLTAHDGLPARGGRAMATDRAGNLLASAPGQVLRYQAGRFIPYVTTPGLSVSSILEDRAGRLWGGTTYDGLLCFQNGQVTAYTTRDGLAENYITALFEDRAGNLWIGTGSGISRLCEGRITTWAHKDGYPGRHILSFYEDRTGQIWIGTDGNGLLRFKDGRFNAITIKDGLYDNLAFQILEDNNGNLWMSGNKGIYRASLQELNDFAEGRRKAVTSFAYGMTDGMLSRECNGASPAGWKTSDGRLWFPTIKGVVVVDSPQKPNDQPPQVALEQVMLDRILLPLGQPVEIRPGQENLEIQYTALNWNRPQQVSFKYQLEGRDHAWVEAGTRRTASYAYLPPGTYTFRVIADNGDGMWNTTGQSFRIVVHAPFYQRGWFFVLVLFGSVGVVLSAWKVRVKQLEHRQAQQEVFARRLIESQENERKRIAAELHDSLGQSLALIKNRALSGTHTVNDLQTAQDYFEAINAEAAQAISDVREIAQNLRPYLLDRLGLTKALQAMLEKVADSCDFQLETSLDNVDGLFPAEAEMSLYRIVQESLNNIIKHAEASHVQVTIKRTEGELQILIEDNGNGFDSNEIYSKNGEGNQRGFGLLGITERVRMLSGKQTIQSTPGQGTRISLVFGGIPAGKDHPP